MTRLGTMAMTLVLTCAAVEAAVLEVGPGKKYDHPNAALVDAKAGDTIKVWPGTYEKVALYVKQERLSIDAADDIKAPVVFSGKGFDYSGRGRVPRAIVQFNPGADGCGLSGIELTGASNGSHNGAGVRINGANDVAIDGCHIHGNDMGVMSNGDMKTHAASNRLVRYCHIHHNGNADDPGYNHNLYLGGDSVALVGCHVHHATTGHNVKSRAHQTTLINCLVHDSANRELDLVDAAETARPNSHTMILFSTIVKDPECRGNKGVIHFGAEKGEHDGTLYIVNSVIVTPFVSPVVQLSAKKANAAVYNTIVFNPGRQQDQVLVDATGPAKLTHLSVRGNWLSRTFAAKLPDHVKATVGIIGDKAPPFAKADGMDYRIDRGGESFGDGGAVLGPDDLPRMAPLDTTDLWRSQFKDHEPSIGLP